MKYCIIYLFDHGQNRRLLSQNIHKDVVYVYIRKGCCLFVYITILLLQELNLVYITILLQALNLVVIINNYLCNYSNHKDCFLSVSCIPSSFVESHESPVVSLTVREGCPQESVFTLKHFSIYTDNIFTTDHR